MNGRVVAGLWLDNDVGVGGFSVDFAFNCAIVFAGDVGVKESYGFVFLGFSGEFDSGVDLIENLVELFEWVFVYVRAAEARSSGCVAFHDAETIVHVDLKVTRKRETPGFGDLEGHTHCVDHPNLGHSHHKREADWPAVFGCMVAAVINKVSLFEAEVQ